MASAANRPSNNLPLPEALLSQLADLANVPQEAREEFSDFIVNRLLPDLPFAVEDRKLVGRHMKRPGQTSGPGRPKGRVNDLVVGQLVGGLLHIAERTGGRFTFTKSSGTGSLIDAIQLLAPCVPVNQPASSTLQRIKTRRTKKNKEDRAHLKGQLSRILTSQTAIEANLERFMGPCDGGMSRPSAFATCMLITSWNLVGA
jgi:hypothetical protein